MRGENMKKMSAAKRAYKSADSIIRSYRDEDNGMILDNAYDEARREIIYGGLYEEDEEKLLGFFRL
jgi:hypothetical protein